MIDRKFEGQILKFSSQIMHRVFATLKLRIILTNWALYMKIHAHILHNKVELQNEELGSSIEGERITPTFLWGEAKLTS